MCLFLIKAESVMLSKVMWVSFSVGGGFDEYSKFSSTVSWRPVQNKNLHTIFPHS